MHFPVVYSSAREIIISRLLRLIVGAPVELKKSKTILYYYFQTNREKLDNRVLFGRRKR